MAKTINAYDAKIGCDTVEYCNTVNGYMTKVSRPKTEWGKSKTNYQAINDWATLPSALNKLMPKTIFECKLKQFLLSNFNLN